VDNVLKNIVRSNADNLLKNIIHLDMDNILKNIILLFMRQKSDYKRLEHLVRGFANHRRIAVMELLQSEPDLDVLTLSRRFKVHFKTMSAHLKRLHLSGLITKKNAGQHVVHRLTDRGEDALKYVLSL
jgi:predicted transcriptional regulator